MTFKTFKGVPVKKKTSIFQKNKKGVGALTRVGLR